MGKGREDGLGKGKDKWGKLEEEKGEILCAILVGCQRRAYIDLNVIIVLIKESIFNGKR